jgi:hypothetical protein
MSQNSQIIQKADIVLQDLVTNGGVLLPEQADTFIRKLIVQPTILSQIRVVTMNANQRNINKIGFGGRILRKAVQGVALDATGTDPAAGRGARSKPVTESLQLNTHEVIAEVRLPYDVIEDNIERGNINAAGANTPYQPVMGGIKDTIMSMIAERTALDLEELALLGDTLSADAYLGLTDGFLKRISTHIVDANGEPISKEIFKQGLKTMPAAYLRNLAAMKNFVSINNELEYRDSLGNRETPMGDNYVQGRSPAFAYGVPVEAVALMPGSMGLLTHPQNLIMGIQRQISVEVDKSITERCFIIVLTAKIDFQVEELDAAVKYTDLAL